MAWQGGTIGGYARSGGDKVTAVQWNALVESLLYLKGQGGEVAIENHLKPGTTATYDLGVSGAIWRDLKISRNAEIGGTLAVTGVATFTAVPVIPVPRVQVRDADNTCTVSGVHTYLPWDTEDFDTDTMHDNVTNNSRLTATTAGTYLVYFTGSTTASVLFAIEHSSGSNLAYTPVLASDHPVSLTAMAVLTAGQYVRLRVSGVSGSRTITNQVFGMIRIA